MSTPADPYGANAEYHGYPGGYSQNPYGTLYSDEVGRYTYADIPVGFPSEREPQHLRWPLQLPEPHEPPGPFRTVEQDTLAEVTQSVQIMLNTVVGERLRDAPHYGIPEPITGNPQNTQVVLDQAARFEPRAALNIRTGGVTAEGTQLVAIDIDLNASGIDVTPDLDRRPHE